MANNFTPVGSEIQINLAPNQNDDQIDPDIASLTDGRFFVAFVDRLGGFQFNIIGQFVNADGTLSGSNFDIATDGSTNASPAVAQRAGGGALVVWTHQGGTFEEIHFATVSSAGAVGVEQTILSGATTGFVFPDVAPLADGRWLVAAMEFDPGVDVDIVFRFIDSAGNPLGVQGFIDDEPASQFFPAVATSGNTALVVYGEEVGIGDLGLQARFYDGSTFAAEIAIDGTIVDAPGVAVLTDGRFAVVYIRDDASVHGRFVSATGALSTGFEIADLGGLNTSARVAALPDGGFIVTWAVFAGDLPPEERVAVLARRFDATGTPVGDIFVVNQGDEDGQDNPAIATNAAGQTLIAWEDGRPHTGAGEDAEPDGVRGRAFIPTTDVVNGTPLADFIQTYNLGETINGLEGDDVINALGGDDIVHGNAGLDRILGGLGNDQLFGHRGEDLLNGEDGDDLLVGGLGRDVQIGGLGKDIFDFNTLNESRVGAGRDVIKGFNHAEHDKINLRTIDADRTRDGNQAFDLIGAAAFTGAAAELRFVAGRLQGDTNGDGIADFEVKVIGLDVAGVNDFVL